MEAEVKDLVAQILPEIIDLRHQLHQIPELGYKEHKTSRLLATKLASYGYEVQTDLGVVALLDSGRPGPTIALRADMDGLPIEEATQAPYASSTPRRHACLWT